MCRFVFGSWVIFDRKVEGRCLVWVRGRVGCFFVWEEGFVSLSLFEDFRFYGRSSWFGVR